MFNQSRWAVALALQAVFAAVVWAAPADDYRLAQVAFQRGDVADAMKILRPPAAAGHAASQSLLAFILDRADFPEEAVGFYTSAAAQGDAEAHAGLANLYLTGRGIAKDEKAALAHFSKAADQGHAAAAQVLAEAHLKGTMGLGAEPRDNARATADLRRAADQGYLPAAEALVQAYRVGGYGLAADAAQATIWQTRIAELRKQRAGPPVPAAKKAKP